MIKIMGGPAVSLALLLAACGGDEGGSSQTPAASSVQPVDFETLKDFCPQSAGVFKRANLDAYSKTVEKLTVSQAVAQYQTGEKGAGTLWIMDYGSMKAAGPTHGWIDAEMTLENDSNYVKTVTYRGYRGLEEYHHAGKSGSLRVIVGGRFVVMANGSGVEMSAIRALMDGVDLEKLAALK
jgi:hypothetical protein